MKIRIGVRKDTGEPFELDVREYMIKSGLAIMGKRGVGKSYLVGLIAERLAEVGQQFVIIDVMGQYYTLKQSYPVIVISMGNEDYADLKGVTSDMAEDVARVILESGQSVVVDVSYATMLEQYKFMSEFFRAFYETAKEVRRPVVLIIDEIHRITPEKSMIKLKEVAKYQNEVAYWVAEIARTGRKHGIGYIVAGQREAETAKTSLTQCEVQINFKVTGIDFENLKRKVSPELIDEIRNLRVGEAVVLGLDEEFIIQVDERKTPHGGETPAFTPVEVEISSFVELLEKVKSKKMEKSERDESVELLRKRIKDLEVEREKLLLKVKSLTEDLNRLQNETREEFEKEISTLQYRIRELEEENARLKQELEEKNKRIEELEKDLITASEFEKKLESIREASMSVIDAISEFAEAVGIELYPSDVSELLRRVRELEERVELYENTEKERKRLAEQALSDAAVKHAIQEMKSEINSILFSEGSLPEIFKQVVRFDPDVVFYVGDISANVSESTIRSHLRKLVDKGIIAEVNSSGGKKGYKNVFYAWVNSKLRKVKPMIPDDAVDRVYEELRGKIFRV